MVIYGLQRTAGNNRVLEYTAPLFHRHGSLHGNWSRTGASAFSTYLVNDGGSVAAGTLFQPTGLAFDAHGNLWVTDSYNERVLEFGPPFGNGMAATLALGESDLVHNTTQSASQHSMSLPAAVAFDMTGNLLVTDAYARIMVFTPPFSSGMECKQRHRSAELYI